MSKASSRHTRYHLNFVFRAAGAQSPFEEEPLPKDPVLLLQQLTSHSRNPLAAHLPRFPQLRVDFLKKPTENSRE
jgi:hypothetical protein